ncbi:MAG: hypothetical protein NUV67_01155 [archaeon]|nr:hypothetical protein [archaeon]
MASTSVTIGVTAPHTIPARFLKPFLAIVAYTHQKVGPVNVSVSNHYCTYEARNECVKNALNNNSDYLFFLDADVLAPPNVIEELIKKEKDIISGPVHIKSPPYRPLAYRKGKIQGTYDLDPQVEEEKLYEVDGVGGGCLLIKKEALKKIGDPQFHFILNGKNIGEDLYFSHKAQEAGYTIWYDNTIRDVTHFGAAIGFSDYRLWNYHVKQGHIKFEKKE